MGPGRLVAEPVQGPWSSDLHSMPFLYLIHPFPPGSLEVISSCHQPVLDLGTIKGNKASARIRVFSEAGWDQEGQQGPVPLCTALLLGQLGRESFHTCPCGNKFYSRPIGLWTPRREGGSYTCDTPGVSASVPWSFCHHWESSPQGVTIVLFPSSLGNPLSICSCLLCHILSS